MKLTCEALRICGVPVKWASLVLLTFVTTWTIFAIKLARSSSKEYLNSSVVLFTELLKLFFSFSLLSLETKSPQMALRSFWLECRSNPLGLLKLCVPGLAYTIQNNLIFLSVDLLSAAVQQVTYQLKTPGLFNCNGSKDFLPNNTQGSVGDAISNI